jgi:DNA repair exonuclease SbcCD ATPase subunit
MAKKKYVDEFYLSNIKKHAQLEEKVHGRHFAMIGPNGAGKTSVFQAIRRLLASLPDTEKPEIWLKQGAENGEMRIVLVSNGDVYQVQEKISNKPGVRSRIRLFKISGDKRDELTPAQQRIAEIFGNVQDLTPLIDMSGTEQFQFLKDKLGINSAKYDKERKELVQERSSFKGARNMQAMMLRDLKEPTEEELVQYASERHPEELEKKVDIEPLNQTVDKLKGMIAAAEKIEQRIGDIDAEIKRLQQERAGLVKELKILPDAKKDLEKATKLVEDARKKNAEIDEQLEQIINHNRKHYSIKNYQQKLEDINKLKKQQEEKNKEIEDLDRRFFDSLAAIPFGEVYPGLELVYQPADDDQEKPEKIGLYLDALPFNRKQLSYGIMIKSLIKLSAFLNPDGLNFVYISDWNLLDSNNQKDLLEFAESQTNVQLGIEKVDDRTEIAVEFFELK